MLLLRPNPDRPPKGPADVHVLKGDVLEHGRLLHRPSKPVDAGSTARIALNVDPLASAGHGEITEREVAHAVDVCGGRN